MIVLIPHKEDQLILFSFQKKLIASLYKTLKEDDLLIYENYPLWINLFDYREKSRNEDLKYLKELSKKITNFKIKTDKIIEEKLSDNKWSYYFPVSLTLEGGKFVEAKLIIYHSNKKAALSNKEKVALSQKIFRLGITCNITNNSQAISSFVWKKLT